MRLHHNLLNLKTRNVAARTGFTLVETIAAAAAGALVSMMTFDLLFSHIRLSGKVEAIQRTRQDWARTTHFIDSEVALSKRIITNPTAINNGQCNTIANSDFRFALEIRNDLQPAIYYIASNPSNSKTLNGDLSLYRCGPGIDRTGEYLNTVVDNKLLVDGMTADCQIDPTLIKPNASIGSGKSLGYELCLQGQSNERYSQAVNTYSRVTPLSDYPPSNTSVCSGLTIEGIYQLEGSPGADNLQVAGSTNGQPILICGNGGGDTITGTTFDDVLEAGDSGGNLAATISGSSGSDILRGGPGDDKIYGEDGDDVLMGQAGDDTLEGGAGNNEYLPGEGDDTITGGPGLDVVYLYENKESVTGLSNCKREACNLSFESNSNLITATDVEVIIFKDGRYNVTN